MKIIMAAAQKNRKLESENVEKTSAEQYFEILRLHNLDTARIRQNYISYCDLRQRSFKEGISFEELKK